MKNYFGLALLITAALSSCAGSSNQNSQPINSRQVETSETPTSDEVRKVWDEYMNDKLNLPTKMATIDIDGDGIMEYIYAKRCQQMIMVCTFNTKDRLRLAAASCHEQKDFYICKGAGVSEAIETTEYQEERHSVIEGSKLTGVYYEIMPKDGSGQGKWQYSTQTRDIRKDIPNAEFEAKTSAYNSPTMIDINELNWQEYKL